MPIYTLKNTETDEIFDVMLKISEYEIYLKENPHIQRHFESANRFIDEIALGRKQPPPEFQRHIERMKQSIPGANKSPSRFKAPREW